MMMNNPEMIFAAAIPIVFAITVHEAAHGLAAKYFGDDTAARMGRITLNPIPHIDPVGTILIPLITYMLAGGMFGWAKPVPVDFDRLKHGKLGVFVVAFAGPLSNLIMAVLFGLLLGFSNLLPPEMSTFAEQVGLQGTIINLSFFALNLVPIPPLDGGRMMHSILPRDLAAGYARIEPYGFYILLGLMMTGLLSFLTRPIMGVGLSIVKTFL